MNARDWVYSKFETVQDLGGGELQVLCCFHDDSRPSLGINVDKCVYHCWGCHAKGKISQLIARLGGPANFDISADHLRARLEQATAAAGVERVYPERWLELFAHPHPYWERVAPISTGQWQLGFDPMVNCVTIPLRDFRGRLLGVIRRVLDDSAPKYRYPAHVAVSRLLWGYSEALKARTSTIAIGEGALDAVACWEAGFPAVALLGSTMSEEQATWIAKGGWTKVVIATDNDQAGHQAAQSVRERLSAYAISISAPEYPDGVKDPGELDVAARGAWLAGA